MSTRHRIIDLPTVPDERGLLSFAQMPEKLPFPPERIFILYGMKPGGARGDHAHREQHQYLIMMHGSAAIEVDDGLTQTSVRLTSPAQALYIPPMLWLRMNEFSDGAVCAVLASGIYDESDYIRSYDEFQKLTTAVRP